MPLNIGADPQTKFPSPQYLTLSSFKKGVITLVDQSLLPRDALKEADNIFLYENGQPGPRPGVNWYGAVSPNSQPIQGFDYYQTSSGTSHIVMVAGGNIYRSTDDAVTWTICTGATLNTTAKVSMCQDSTYLYITNGINNIVRYDGSTSLVTYTTLTTPAAPTIVETGLTGTANSYTYKIAAVNSIGFTVASVASAAVQSTLDRTAWNNTTDFATLTLPALQPSQLRTDVYVSSDTVNYYYLGSSSTTTFIDDGSMVANPAIEAPVANTTQGPLVEQLRNVGSRMAGVRDTVNKYRVWFSSAILKGAFSSSYDGTYIDWQKGGKLFPVQAEDYRDGKGTPYITVWCNSADGQGCVIQVSLDTVDIGGVSITIPSAYKLPGSRGTPAPGSVVNVLNDYYYYNSQAFYNIGSRAQLQNILSTDEASSNIRPTVRQISTVGESGICSVYFDAKIYWSVPYGSSSNNAVCLYDTERRAWLPKAFNIGFSQFLKYTDNSSSKSQRLLALKQGDNRLSEISSSIQGDYGVAFSTSLITGLYPVSKNRFEFEWTEEGEVEFSNPNDPITVQLLGIERTRGYRTTKTATVTGTTLSTGWDTFGWDTSVWDDTSVVPDTFSESSVKRYFNVQRELNAVQWVITTNSLAARYVLRTLQTWGTPTFAGKPRSWRI